MFGRDRYNFGGVGYEDRGSTTGYDFTQATLTQDTQWNELDLSTIVPENAKAVNIHFRASDATVGRILYVRPHGDTTNTGTCTIRNQVSGVSVGGYFVTGVDSDQKIDYKSNAPGYTTVNFLIKGWWF